MRGELTTYGQVTTSVEKEKRAALSNSTTKLNEEWRQ